MPSVGVVVRKLQEYIVGGDYALGLGWKLLPSLSPVPTEEYKFLPRFASEAQ